MTFDLRKIRSAKPLMPKDVASIIGISPSQVRRLSTTHAIDSFKLPNEKSSQHRRVPLETILEVSDEFPYMGKRIYALLDGRYGRINDITPEDCNLQKPEDYDTYPQKIFLSRFINHSDASEIFGLNLKTIVKYGLVNVVIPIDMDDRKIEFIELLKFTKKIPFLRRGLLRLLEKRKFEKFRGISPHDCNLDALVGQDDDTFWPNETLLITSGDTAKFLGVASQTASNLFDFSSSINRGYKVGGNKGERRISTHLVMEEILKSGRPIHPGLSELSPMCEDFPGIWTPDNLVYGDQRASNPKVYVITNVSDSNRNINQLSFQFPDEDQGVYITRIQNENGSERMGIYITGYRRASGVLSRSKHINVLDRLLNKSFRLLRGNKSQIDPTSLEITEDVLNSAKTTIERYKPRKTKKRVIHKNRRNTLSEEEKGQIRQLADEGKSGLEISRIVGRSNYSVQRVLSGESAGDYRRSLAKKRGLSKYEIEKREIAKKGLTLNDVYKQRARKAGHASETDYRRELLIEGEQFDMSYETKLGIKRFTKPLSDRTGASNILEDMALHLDRIVQSGSDPKEYETHKLNILKHLKLLLALSAETAFFYEPEGVDALQILQHTHSTTPLVVRIQPDSIELRLAQYPRGQSIQQRLEDISNRSKIVSNNQSPVPLLYLNRYVKSVYKT